MSLHSIYPWVPSSIASPQPSPPPPSKTTVTAPPGLSLVGARGKPKGRSLRATCSYPAGSAIAVFDRPLVAVPAGKKVTSTCDWCLRRGTSSLSPPTPPQKSHLQQPVPLSVCTGCNFVFYCSKSCQAAAWKNVHKYECPWLKKAAGRVPGGERGEYVVSEHARAVMQLLARLKRNDEVARGAVGDVPSYGEKWMEGREGMLEGLPEVFRESEGGRMWREWTQKAMGALDMTGFEHGKYDHEKLFGERGVVTMVTELFCKIQINAFNTEDPDYSNPGILVDTVLSMANHSCIPNAAVRLAGRTTILRALTDIRAGAEIEVSYIDWTESTTERRQKLAGYHFTCQCRRCTRDLDVYQVAATSPVRPMNILSLQPNLQLYHNPDIDRAKFKREFPYPRTSNGAPNFPLATERARALLTAEMWAVHPLPEMYATFIVHDGEEEQNLAYALAAACFRATRVDPYGYVAPFEPWRLKGLLVIARLLSQTAPLTATGELTKTCPLPLLAAALEKMDQVTICECVLRLVMYYGPMAHSDDWVVMQSAREMLTDMESLEGRERESAMLQLWLSNPSHPEAQHFFEEMVYKPVMRLADIAMLVIARKMQNGGLEEKLLSRLK